MNLLAYADLFFMEIIFISLSHVLFLFLKFTVSMMLYVLHPLCLLHQDWFLISHCVYTPLDDLDVTS